MRYVFVLTVIFSFNDAATAKGLSTAARLLEIRSIPVIHKHASRLLQKVISYRNKDSTNAYVLAGSTALMLVAGISPDAFGAFELVVCTAGIPVLGAALGTSLVGSLRDHKVQNLYYKSEGRQVYYTELRDGKVILHFGQVTGYDFDTGMLVVASTDGENNKSNKVYFKNLGGISVPDHQDLHRRVKLLSKADSGLDHLYSIGQVSKVYHDGHYEIEVDHEVSFEGQELPIGKPYTVFVLDALPLHEGGFVFTDSEMTEHEASEAVQITSAARQADYTRTEERSAEEDELTF